MQDPRMKNTKKQKSQRTMVPHTPEDYMRVVQNGLPTMPPKTANTHKASKKNTKSDASQFYQQQKRAKSSTQQLESSAAANDYRALRRKYLLLEEESCSLGNELREVEDEIQSLEDVKLELLDQLVVLEGLVDPSEMPSHSSL